MSAAIESQVDRLTRDQNLQSGMKAILRKLHENAKSITAADAQGLSDSTETRDVQMAQIIAAVKQIASFNESLQVNANREAPASTIPSTQAFPDSVIRKLLTDPTSISPEDARRFSENVEVRDAKSARLVSAIESLAAVREDLRGTDVYLGQTPHPSMLTIVRDLLADVEKYPQDVDMEILKTTQAIVNKMQTALNHKNAPHPELEAELQQEYAQIQPEIERGTVSSAEAGHLHSLESRARGHTERGGLTAMAQSVAAKSGHQPPKNENTSASEVVMVKTKMDHAKASSSPTKYRRNQLLTDQTNMLRSYAEGHPQFPSTTKGFLRRNEEKDFERGNLSSLASGDFSRHRREKSQI